MRGFQMMSDPNPETFEGRLRAKREWHRRQAALPLKDKFRILLHLQRLDRPLIARHRRLKSWEQPWNIEP